MKKVDNCQMRKSSWELDGHGERVRNSCPITKKAAEKTGGEVGTEMKQKMQ